VTRERRPALAVDPEYQAALGALDEKVRALATRLAERSSTDMMAYYMILRSLISVGMSGTMNPRLLVVEFAKMADRLQDFPLSGDPEGMLRAAATVLKLDE
jgi:hypothetical protein